MKLLKQALIVTSLLFFLANCSSRNGQTTQTDSSTKSNNEYYDLELTEESDYLIRIPQSESYIQDPCAYVNTKGDTIIPMGSYDACLTDTIRTFGIVWDETTFIGIDKKGRKLYEIFFYDNGPDWIEEGLFRIQRNNKIGYANEKGIIIIDPQFECASQFENGQARVAYSCELVPDGEYTMMKSEEWFYIDAKGNKVSGDD